jgi:hypothetical protein
MRIGLRGRRRTHRGQFLVRGCEGRLDRGDFTEPALVLGFLEPIDKVGADLLQSR